MVISQSSVQDTTSTGAVEAKVVCFYRRRDLSLNLIELADKHHKELSISTDPAQPELLHQIRHRELFLSRQLETLPATHIRGKCAVTLHNDMEPCVIYLSKEDAFFFQLVYDPVQKTLQADRGTMREGADYQAEVMPYKPPVKDSTTDEEKPREELRWKPPTPDHLSSTEIDSYLLLVRSLGTLSRAYHPAGGGAGLRHPSLSTAAAAAGRDTTHQLGLDTLHAAGYDVPRALQVLCPNSQPLLQLDEMELWSASEGNLFEEALEKYGKCFYEIQSDFLPWKHPKSLVQFYYMWKTTEHYVQQKRIQAAEAEHHLKQVYIPNYNKPNPLVLYPSGNNANGISNTGGGGTTTSGRIGEPHSCEACQATVSPQWYALGPISGPLKVCADCWTYWKRYGELKVSSVLDKVCNINNSSPPSSCKINGDVTASSLTSIAAASASVVNGNLPDHPSPSTSVSSTNDAQNPQPVLSQQQQQHLIAAKLRGSIGFQFRVNPLLRLCRRRLLRLPTNPVRSRRPFVNAEACLLSTSQSDAQLLLTPDAIKSYIELLQAAAKTRKEVCTVEDRKTRLLKVFSRVFPDREAIDETTVGAISKPEESGDVKLATNDNEPNSTIPADPLASAVNGLPLTETPPTSVESSESLDSRKRPASPTSPSTESDEATAAKKPHIAPPDEPIADIKSEEAVSIDTEPAINTTTTAAAVDTATIAAPVSSTVSSSSSRVMAAASSIRHGPKRRFGVDSDQDGASTLMFRVTEKIKRSRRRLHTGPQLRRFGRHPHTVTGKSSSNGPLKEEGKMEEKVEEEEVKEDESKKPSIKPELTVTQPETTAAAVTTITSTTTQDSIPLGGLWPSRSKSIRSDCSSSIVIGAATSDSVSGSTVTTTSTTTATSSTTDTAPSTVAAVPAAVNTTEALVAP